MRSPKYSKVKEYADALFIDDKEVPYILLKDNGDTTTETKLEGDHVVVTITFLAKSYSLNPHRRIHDSFYRFKKDPYRKRLFSKLNTFKRELSRIKGSLFS